jgi:hypothetical protein
MAGKGENYAIGFRNIRRLMEIDFGEIPFMI